MAESVSFPLVRADDNLSLRVTVTGTPALLPGGWSVHPPIGGNGLIAVDFPPQHLVEYADSVNELAPFQSVPIYAPPTRVIFHFSSTIPLSVEGILDAMASRQLVVGLDAPFVQFLDPTGATAAARTGDGVADGVASVRRRRAEAQVRDDAALVRLGKPPSESAAAARAAEEAGVLNPSTTSAPRVLASPPLPVTTTATSVSLPSRLELAIAGLATRFSHATRPVEHGGLVEQWHSRLAVAVSGTGERREVRTPVVVRSSVPTPASSDEDWMKRVAEDTVNNALDSATAALIRNAAKLPGGLSDTRRPLDMDRLTLSPLGGSIRLAGRWTGQQISNYRHSVVQGRDDEVRVDVEGQLYPFGHKARLARVTTRAPRSPADGSPAVLRTSAVLTVLQPVVQYPDDAQARKLPWKRIEILSPVSPPGDFEPRAAGSADGHLEVGGQPYRMECRAVDHADHVTTFSLAMYFVAGGNLTAATTSAWKTRGSAFTQVTLRGQSLGVAPVSPGAGVADATTLMTNAVRLQTDPPVMSFRAEARDFTGRSPALGAVGADVDRTFTYASQYLDAGFAKQPAFQDGPSNPGELLLTMGASLVDMGREAVGLVTAPELPMRGISRLVGAVSAAGDTENEITAGLATAALGEFDPEVYLGDLPATLFGIFPLKDLLAQRKGVEGPLDLAANAPKQFVETIDGRRTVSVHWSTVLVPAGKAYAPTGDAFPDFLQLLAGETSPITFTLDSATSASTDGAVTTRTTCEILDATIGLGLKSDPLVTLPIRRVSFESTDGAAPKVDVGLGAVGFHGPLSFVSTLAELIAESGLGGARTGSAPALAPNVPANGPYVTLIDGGVQAGLTLAIPDLAIGMFSLQDLTFSSRFDLYFDGRPPQLSLDFSTPDNPFGLSVSAIAGGGYLGIVLSTKGIVGIKGALEFGASVAVDIGIAAGRASVMGGLYFEILDTGASLTGYLRMEGHVEVLKLITNSLVMAMYLTYTDDGKVRGEAEVSFTIKMLFFSKTVSTTVKKTFAGSNSDPSFAELMAPADWPADEPLPWDTYCRAFAAA